MSNILLSIICSCRNDNYGENLLDRIYYFLRSIDRFTIPIEIIIVEWNPLEDYELLSSIISKWNTHVNFKHDIKIITVSNKNHNEFINNFNYNEPSRSFQEYPAKNVGIRRSTGKYILQTNPDIFYPLDTIRFIERLVSYEINSLVTCGVPRGKRIDLLEVNHFTSMLDHKKQTEIDKTLLIMDDKSKQSKYIKKINSGALGDFMIFKKEHAIKIKGFKECPIILHHYEQPFVDSFSKISVYEKQINGINIYHFDHSRISYEKTDESQKINPTNLGYNYLTTLVNNDNWGCIHLQLDEYIVSNNSKQ